MYKSALERVGNGSVKVIDCVPAFAEGKLYKHENFPIVIGKHEGRKGKAPCIVHGALFTLELNEEGFKNLDAYEGCSRQRMLKNLSTDVFHRHLVDVRRVYYKSIEDFVNYDFTVNEKTEKAWMYLGNMNNPVVQHTCIKLRRKNGVLWKTYFNVFS